MQLGFLKPVTMQQFLVDIAVMECQIPCIKEEYIYIYIYIKKSCAMPNPMCLVEEVVRYLVEARADKDKVNQRGAPAIHMAALSGHVAVVQLLVDLGTDKDQSDCNGAGPLQLSAEQGQLPVVTYLTEVQGLVNVPFWGYWTSPYSSHLVDIYRPLIPIMVG